MSFFHISRTTQVSNMPRCSLSELDNVDMNRFHLHYQDVQKNIGMYNAVEIKGQDASILYIHEVEAYKLHTNERITIKRESGFMKFLIPMNMDPSEGLGVESHGDDCTLQFTEILDQILIPKKHIYQSRVSALKYGIVTQFVVLKVKTQNIMSFESIREYYKQINKMIECEERAEKKIVDKSDLRLKLRQARLRKKKKRISSKRRKK